MSAVNVFNQHRLLLYYKGDISALTLFAQHGNGSVCFPEPCRLCPARWNTKNLPIAK